MSETFIKSLKGMWGLSGTDDPELGKVQDLSRISFIGSLSHLRRVNMPLDRSLKLFKPHRLHPQQWGIMCPYETPDGESIGYLKNLALITRITAGNSMDDIKECLESTKIFIYLNRCNMKVINHKDVCKVFVNGTWFGVTYDPINLYRYLKLCKRSGCINILTSVSWIVKINEIRLLTEGGRAVRPLIVVDEGKLRPINENWFEMLLGSFNKDLLKYDEEIYTKNGFLDPFDTMNTTDLAVVLDKLEETAGSIEYVDVDEEDVSLIAIENKDITARHNYREIHPSTILSVVSVNIPLCNHTFAPRNIFHAAQTKQAIGIYATSFNERFDTMAYIQHYPEKPLVSTKPSFLTKSELMPNGFNLIVAVMTYSGFNQEDSLMINKGALDRGLETISYYKSITMTAKVESQYERTIFTNPIKLRDSGKIVKNMKGDEVYKFIDEDGFVKVGTIIPEGKDTAVVGMVLEKTVAKTIKDGMFTKTVLEKEYIDKSFITDDNYYGVIDKVFVSNKTSNNDTTVCKVRFLKVRRPEFGDKHSSRHGQKGVIGRIFNEEDMPFTKDGIRPDIIMNPHAFPSRMTIGHIVECVFAKLCCIQGTIGDGTVFMPFDKEFIMDELNTEGFDRSGNEILYSGITGQQIHTDIYIGPVYYLRLKHMVADKINARGYGPMTYMTRQPTAGRRKKGGNKIGEMERDALLAHGASLFVKESMMERSDAYNCLISEDSGTIYGANSDVPAYINMPYSFKQLTQEFEAMGIQMSFNREDIEVVPPSIHEIEIDTESNHKPKLNIQPVKEKKVLKKKPAQEDNKPAQEKVKDTAPKKAKEKTCDDIKCPEDKICNPATLKCVAQDGKIGKKLKKMGGYEDNDMLFNVADVSDDNILLSTSDISDGNDDIAMEYSDLSEDDLNFPINSDYIKDDSINEFEDFNSQDDSGSNEIKPQDDIKEILISH
eukprot:768657-Hanusia_phi.AAC.3